MGVIGTTHSPNAYTDEQIAEMLLVHAGLNRGNLWVVTKPEHECDDVCDICRNHA